MSNDLGLDRSGNGNNWTVNNLAYSDQMVDSPTNNFATMNPLVKHTNVATTYSEGNLKIYKAASYWTSTLTTMYMDSGKWYAEFCCLTDGAYMIFGINAEGDLYANNHPGADSSGYGYGYVFDTAAGRGDITYQNQTVSTGGAFTNLAVGTIIGITLDFDNNQVKFYANNALQYTESIGARPYTYSLAPHGGYIVSNFGQDSSFAGNKTAQGNQDGNSIGDFYYTPPSGFLALCTSNLPDVAVVPSEHFNTVLYTGNGSGALAISGVGFQPDFTWIKSRNSVITGSHELHDAVRGAGKRIFSNDTAAETDFSTVDSFDSDGFTVGLGTGGQNGTNANTATFAAWNWKANGSGSSNTDGDLNSTVSVNTDAGFSIVSWVSNTNSTSTTSTIGHGLSQTAEMVITKKRSSGARNWHVGHKDLPFTSGSNSHNGVLSLNSTVANEASNTGLADIPNATTFIARGDNGDDYIAYCFHSVDGYSKVGSYLGNISSGTADGTYVYTGFRPAWVMIKDTEQAVDWAIYDSTRLGFNQSNYKLEPSNASAEQATTTHIQLNSNGFNFMTDNSNYSGRKYIYLCFAETPFKYSNAR